MTRLLAFRLVRWTFVGFLVLCQDSIVGLGAAGSASAVIAEEPAGPDWVSETPPAVLPGVNADPHIAAFGDTFYIYPTTDGSVEWKSTSFHAWSSRDLVHWTDEGVILDLPRDVGWAKIHAWAPAIATKNAKYYYYYSANKNIGVAVADRPEGPFVEPLGKPLVAREKYQGMQCIDPMVFVDDDGAADRSRSKIYVGEYAAHETNRRNTLRSAHCARRSRRRPT